VHPKKKAEKAVPPISTSGKISRKSWPFLFIRILGSLMQGSTLGLRDLDNLVSLFSFSLFFRLVAS
jgi:hypothetical protein